VNLRPWGNESWLLHPAASRHQGDLSPELLATITESLASLVNRNEVPVPPGQQRGYYRLMTTASFEVWLIAWKPSAALALHDHGGSRGLIRVARGTLSEMYMDPNRRTRARTRHLHAGASVEVPADRIHEVWNAGPRDAVSVHAYSPPLATMTFYEPGGAVVQGVAPVEPEREQVRQ
jgi:predicted metal-dependent enzyme (double-stranded beta helix superfamily)